MLDWIVGLVCIQPNISLPLNECSCMHIYTYIVDNFVSIILDLLSVYKNQVSLCSIITNLLLNIYNVDIISLLLKW